MKKQMPRFMAKYSSLFARSQIMEQILPRKVSSAQDLFELNPNLLRHRHDFDKAELDAINKGMLEPIYDLLDRGGKRWRPVLGMVFAECYGRNVTQSIE
jgi:hypothetical protein